MDLLGQWFSLILTAFNRCLLYLLFICCRMIIHFLSGSPAKLGCLLKLRQFEAIAGLLQISSSLIFDGHFLKLIVLAVLVLQTWHKLVAGDNCWCVSSSHVGYLLGSCSCLFDHNTRRCPSCLLILTCGAFCNICLLLNGRLCHGFQLLAWISFR